MSLAVPARIYANALRLKLKGAPLPPPPRGATHERRWRPREPRLVARDRASSRAAPSTSLLRRVRSGRMRTAGGVERRAVAFGPTTASSGPRSWCTRPRPTGCSCAAQRRPRRGLRRRALGHRRPGGAVPDRRARNRPLDACAAALRPCAARSQRLATLPVLNTRRGARRNIAAHYDLGNELFELFLDREWMMYSSALFERARSDAGGGPAGQARADLRAPRARARPAPARDRHRLGRPRHLRGLALRLPRDHDDDLARAT